MTRNAGSQSLSFFKYAKGRIVSFWLIEAVEEWGTGNAIGRDRADEFLVMLQPDDVAFYLPRIVEAMNGEVGAVEVGFLTRIGEFAASSSACGGPKIKPATCRQGS
jgi:hypothetical protein